MRARFGPTRLRASETKLRANSGSQARSGADDVERRAVGARALARRRHERAGADALDRGGELRLEQWHVLGGEHRHDGLVRLLEELVDDLDLLRPGAEARQRVDEPLQAVVRVGHLLRRSSLERVRLEVDDECVRPQQEDVDEAV